MSSNVEQFANWAQLLGDRLPEGSGLTLNVSDGSAFIDVDGSDGRKGRLIYWEDGSADCSIYDTEGDLIDFTRDPAWKGPWGSLTSSDFDAAFACFTDEFTRSGGRP